MFKIVAIFQSQGTESSDNDTNVKVKKLLTFFSGEIETGIVVDISRSNKLRRGLIES